ncbi:MAG: hypothetical protein AAF335_04760, partial [Bacteroidota bacterium]
IFVDKKKIEEAEELLKKFPYLINYQIGRLTSLIIAITVNKDIEATKMLLTHKDIDIYLKPTEPLVTQEAILTMR